MDLVGYARMQKDEGANSDPNLFPSVPDPIKNHPLFSGTMPVAFMTGSDPKYPTKIAGQSDGMKTVLDKMGLKYERTNGKYGGPMEDSFVVYNPTREQAFDLGHQFGQESVMYSHGGNHQILFTNGENAGRYHPSLPQVWYHPTQAPEDYYTQLPNAGYMRLHFDWDTLRDAPDKDVLTARMNPATPSQVQQVAKSITPSTTLKKNEGALPHPHLYPWHEGHTSQHFVTTGHGVLVHRNHFEQQLGKSERMWAPIAKLLEKAWAPAADGVVPQYGTSQAVMTPSYLPLHGQEQAADNLLKNYGYSAYYYGGRHGRPDLARRNYDTRALAIFDPSSGSEGAFQHQAYTNTWRKFHELAHALTHDQINKMYGSGRRRGSLGQRRTLREAMRAVHWEHLAMHKQRDLMRQAGIEISDKDFHRELNTVMQDAVHRVTTGAEQHPSLHSFAPHEHEVPVEASLNLIRQAAHNLGLRGPHDLVIKKSEQEHPVADKTPTVQELRKSLATTLRGVLEKHELEMAKLRERELKKSGGMCSVCGGPLRKDEHAFVAGKGNEREVKTCQTCGKHPENNPEHFEVAPNGAKKMRKGDGCPVCKAEDKPGLCKCFKKGEGVAAKPAKVSGDQGSGGQIKPLTKEALPAVAARPPVARPAAPKPTSVAQVNQELGGFKSLAGGGPHLPSASPKLVSVPPTASAAPKLPGVGAPAAGASKPVLGVPTRKGEKPWTKKVPKPPKGVGPGFGERTEKDEKDPSKKGNKKVPGLPRGVGQGFGEAK